MSGRPTPETDDLARGNHVVPTEWAEQLEIERNEAREKLDEEMKWHHRTHTELVQAQCKLLDMQMGRDEACEELNDIRLNLGKDADGYTLIHAVCVLQNERDEARELLRLSSIEANALATSIQKSEYSDVNDFQLCESVAGVISQINNMYAGVREQRDEARKESEYWQELYRTVSVY